MLHVVYIKCSQLITYIWLIALFLCISFLIHGKSGEGDLFVSLILLLNADYCTSYENQTFAVPFANLNCQISRRGQGLREGETIKTPWQPVSHRMWSTAAAWEHLLPSHNMLTFYSDLLIHASSLIPPYSISMFWHRTWTITAMRPVVVIATIGPFRWRP